MKNLTLTLGLLLLFSCAACKQGVVVEKAMSAVEAGDYTALIEGCGNQLVPGYTYCRMTSGQSTNQNIYMVAPPVVCTGKKSEPCVTYQIFGPNGNTVAGGEIARGQTRSKAISWKTLTGRDTFEVADRGFWGFIYSIRFVDKKGREQIVTTQGEIRMRVINNAYSPLHNVSEDRGFVWRFKDGGVQVKMTTGGRTWVSLKEASKTLPDEDGDVSEGDSEQVEE